MELVVVGLWVFIAIFSVGDAVVSLWRIWKTRTSTARFQGGVIVFLVVAIILAWLFR